VSRQHYTSAMNLLRHTTFWTPRVMTCSALKGINIEAIWGMIIDYWTQARDNATFDSQRVQQNLDWMHQLVDEMLRLKLSRNAAIKAMLPELEQAVRNLQTTPYVAARRIIEAL
jgi:LAO/AO transport system kinase